MTLFLGLITIQCSKMDNVIDNLDVPNSNSNNDGDNNNVQDNVVNNNSDYNSNSDGGNDVNDKIILLQ